VSSRNIKASYYFIGFALISLVFIISLELSTRIISLVSGNGFVLNVAEKESYDDSITDLYQFHPFTGFIFTPGSFRGGHVDQKIYSTIYVDNNSFLCNGYIIPLKKEDNEIRIATIGASTTANINLNFDENWPGQLVNKLQQKFPGKKITLINAAVPGYDTSQSIANLSLRVMPYKPDIVIIYHAYNDLKAIRANGEFKPDYSHIHQTPFGFHEKPPAYKLLLEKSMLYVRVRNQYRKILESRDTQEIFNGQGRVRVIPDEAKNTFHDHIQTLVAIAKSGGAKVVISSFATLHDPLLDYTLPATIKGLGGMKRRELGALLNFTRSLSLDGIFIGINTYNKILKDLAFEMNTGWVDNANQVPHDEQYFVDRVHFSAVGAARMADNFLPEVEKAINENYVQ
jgi:lysophospholipase L1-like esterase